jgi:hypothetical protein
MKAHKVILQFKSTKGGDFFVNLPKNFKKVKLPFFQKWVNALESGEYRQCTQKLCAPRSKKLSYCCLGVLSKIQNRLEKDEDGFMLDTLHKSATEEVLHRSNPCYSVIGNDGKLPQGVSVRKNSSDEFVDGTVCEALTECNDDLRLSFKDIAKIIKTVFKE